MGTYGIADILTGSVNPSGKLVDTYALDLYAYPSTDTFLESLDYVRYTDDIYVGYRYFETFVNLVEFNEQQLTLADINGDGVITNSDLVKLIRSILD